MHRNHSNLFFVFLVLLCGININVQAQEGTVTHWEDGTSMGCTYVFEQEPLLEWNQIDPPPVTVKTASAIVRYWGEQKGLENVTVSSLRLIGVRPYSHDHPMLVWFINYIGSSAGQRISYMGESKWLAITPSGSIVEPDCDDP